ncbi:MAG: hypothetical protein J07HR59_00209 [Halorubrum sp. J07HR59]|nr:MAG: hypothetical protein J07HR59_00209 [Halorubrum sp. J07HR59]
MAAGRLDSPSRCCPRGHGVAVVVVICLSAYRIIVVELSLLAGRPARPWPSCRHSLVDALAGLVGLDVLPVVRDAKSWIVRHRYSAIVVHGVDCI